MPWRIQHTRKAAIAALAEERCPTACCCSIGANILAAQGTAMKAFWMLGGERPRDFVHAVSSETAVSTEQQAALDDAVALVPLIIYRAKRVEQCLTALAFRTASSGWRFLRNKLQSTFMVCFGVGIFRSDSCASTIGMCFTAALNAKAARHSWPNIQSSSKDHRSANK